MPHHRRQSENKWKKEGNTRKVLLNQTDFLSLLYFLNAQGQANFRLSSLQMAEPKHTVEQWKSLLIVFFYYYLHLIIFVFIGFKFIPK